MIHKRFELGRWIFAFRTIGHAFALGIFLERFARADGHDWAYYSLVVNLGFHTVVVSYYNPGLNAK